MNRPRLETVSLLVLLGIAAILTFFVFKPFLQILTLAAVFAVLFNAPYEQLVRILGGFRAIAAIIFIALVIVFIIAPILILGTQIFSEAQALYGSILIHGGSYVENIQRAIEVPLQRIAPHFVFNINDYVGLLLNFVSANLGGLVSQTVWVIFETFLILLTLFFFLRDGRSMVTSIMRYSPLEQTHTEEILRQLYRTVVSVVRGTLLVGIIRWFLISIGFFIFGIPDATLWGSIGGIIGAIPGLGTLFVIVPAVGYLYLEGNVIGAIGLTLWGLFVIGLIDNVAAPYFFGRGLSIQPIFVLFAILGGIVSFGPVGFILGPLILSLFLTLMHSYGTLSKGEEITPQ
jgi:predicted PurR-regulated permease PerM